MITEGVERLWPHHLTPEVLSLQAEAIGIPLFQQRVLIARALVNNPALILADEPTGNLDSKTGKKIIELLHSLTKDGKTVILTTHDAALAAKADLILNMEDGKLN